MYKGTLCTTYMCINTAIYHRFVILKYLCADVERQDFQDLNALQAICTVTVVSVVDSCIHVLSNLCNMSD